MSPILAIVTRWLRAETKLFVMGANDHRRTIHGTNRAHITRAKWSFAGMWPRSLPTVECTFLVWRHATVKRAAG